MTALTQNVRPASEGSTGRSGSEVRRRQIRKLPFQSPGARTAAKHHFTDSDRQVVERQHWPMT